MSDNKNKVITIQAVVDAPLDKVWDYWNEPAHIKKWNQASDDWHTPFAENDLRVGGKLLSRMEAKDGSFGFDFGGTYTEVKEKEKIVYVLDDNRKVSTVFREDNKKTHITMDFDAEDSNPIEMQKEGWQAILDNFNKYVSKH